MTETPFLVTAAVVAWLVLAWALSTLMARRGYDRVSWWVTAMIMGPVAAVLAAVELLAPAPRRPVSVERGEVWSGEPSVLVHLDGTSQSEAAARATAELLGASLRRLALVRVLPKDGARKGEELAAQELRRQGATWAPGAGLALIFGPPHTALSEYATTLGFDVVVPGEAVPTERLSGFRRLAGRTPTTRPTSRDRVLAAASDQRSGPHVLQEPAG